MEEKFSLKDHLFNQPKVAQLAKDLARVYPAFREKAFVDEVATAFPVLELKQRIAHIRTCLHTHLPPTYQEAVKVLLNALPAPLDESRSDKDFGDFIYAPFSDYVAHYGCTRQELAFSLAALREITKRFSAEDAIRYFINAFPEETLATLLTWTQDPNYHVRRLCSEGSRPMLPWSQKLSWPPETALPILDRLFADPARYVTRSVANHLNDLAKRMPDLVLNRLNIWSEMGKQDAAEMAFLQKHALRTLVKTGHPAALTLLGFGDHQDISVTEVNHDASVQMGNALSFGFEVSANSPKTISIDYVMHFQNKQGNLAGKKVYKLRVAHLTTNRPLIVEKKHLLRRNMTTRPLFPGTHKVEIQVNGAILAHFFFELLP